VHLAHPEKVVDADGAWRSRLLSASNRTNEKQNEQRNDQAEIHGDNSLKKLCTNAIQSSVARLDGASGQTRSAVGVEPEITKLTPARQAAVKQAQELSERTVGAREKIFSTMHFFLACTRRPCILQKVNLLCIKG
jgi:hypothetical protein